MQETTGSDATPQQGGEGKSPRGDGPVQPIDRDAGLTADPELEALFANTLIGAAITRKRRIIRINVYGAALLGRSVEELIGRDIARFFPSPEANDSLVRLSRQPADALDATIAQGQMRRHTGECFPVRMQAKRVVCANGVESMVWLFDDITAQKQQAEALRTTQQAAEAATEAKLQFLSNMSHELRTPLNGILGMTQLLLDGDQAQGETREFLGIIRQSAEVLMHIMGDLLDLSSVESGRLRLMEREFNLREEFLPLLHSFTTQSQSRPFSFAYQIDPRLPARVIGDPGSTKQILINLLGNAFKYTMRGQVTARIDLQNVAPQASGSVPPRRIRLQVTIGDTGIGIEPDRQIAVFEPFGIGEDYLTKKYSGAGLGLAIAKRLANMMGGEISLKSQPGHGSTFSLTLEYGLPQQAPPAAVRAAAPVSQPGQSRRILLAEDEPVNRIFTVRALQKYGYVVDTAVDGLEALGMLGQTTYDLVLMDIQMPRLNGLDATKRIRAGEVPGLSTTIPIVALSAYAMESDRQRGIEAGMDAYVTKPYDASDLLRAVRQLLTGETLR